MNLTLIAVMGLNNELGLDGKMPWHYPEDLRWFRLNTYGKPILMGRKTFESVGRLPGRLNMVLSKTLKTAPKYCLLFESLEEVFDVIGNIRVYVIGGEKIYEQTILHANELIITKINKTFKADTYFPQIDHYNWDLVFKLPQGDLTFKKYIRK